MGIQDRDYYRNEGPSVLETLMPSGIVCRWLIALNVTAFFLQMVALSTVPLDAHTRSYGWVTDWFILDTGKVLEGEVWRLLTYAFLHEPTIISFHLLFNMLFLWWFGSDIEQLYGRKEFLAIYLISALLGGSAFEIWGIVYGEARCLGASGAVTTMLVLCALHYPRRIVFMWFLPMPIWLFAILNVAQDAYLFAGNLNGIKTSTAVVVHLAGAAFAVGYYKWQHRIVESVRDLMWWRRAGAPTRLKLFRPDPEKEEEPVAVSAASKPQSLVVDEHLEAKLDAVLEKIAKTGRESLTTQEQDILRQAAEMYKRRRN